MDVDKLVKSARKALNEFSNLDIGAKNKFLLDVIASIKNNINIVLEKNREDIIANINLPSPTLDRLKLNESIINNICIDNTIMLKKEDIIGNVIERRYLNSGVLLEKTIVPFGVVLAIFEARPNALIDISLMALKTSNVVILKGGKEAINTNIKLVEIIKDCAINNSINPNIVSLITSSDRCITNELLENSMIDLVIPRGSKKLIDYVKTNSKIPYIETGAGVCHIYIESSASIDMAMKIIYNAKCVKSAVCNSVETILIDDSIAKNVLDELVEVLNKVKLRGCLKTNKYINVEQTTDDDYYSEYNDLIVNIKIVDNYLEAIEHINKYSTKHSDAIISSDLLVSEYFLNNVDSACVYHNASTRFSDGGCFGFGCEVGISTQKLHVRGPMGLDTLTTYKYKLKGNGEIR